MKLKHPLLNYVMRDISHIGLGLTSSSAYNFIFISYCESTFWLLPLDKEISVDLAFAIFQPSTFKSLIYKKIICFLITLNIAKFVLRSNCTLIAKSSQLIEEIFCQQYLTYTIFSGTKSPHRKTCLQVMNKKSSILGYIKVSEYQSVGKLFKNEVEAISFVQSLNLQTALIPDVLSYYSEADYSLIATNTRKAIDTRYFRSANQFHLRFLNELNLKTVHLANSKIWQDLHDSFLEIRPYLSDQLYQLTIKSLLKCKEIDPILQTGFAHGDFTLWNSFPIKDKLYVFDWEYSHHNYPMGFDLFTLYFTRTNLKTIPPCFDKLESLMSANVFDSNILLSRRACLISCIYRLNFYYRRSIENDQVIDSVIPQSLYINSFHYLLSKL